MLRWILGRLGLLFRVLLLFSPVLVSAQGGGRLYFEKINAAIGLPKRTLYYLFESPADHCLYMATNDAVYRYNGFSVQKLQRRSEGDHGYTSIVVMPDGIHYCKNFNGQVFRLEKDHLADVPLPKSIVQSTAMPLLDIKPWGRDMAVVMPKGVYLWNLKTGKTKALQVIKGDTVISQASTPDAPLAWMREDYAYRLNPDTTITRFRYSKLRRGPDVPIPYKNGLYLINRFAVPAVNQVVYQSSTDSVHTSIDIGARDVLSINMDQEYLWINTDDGVLGIRLGETKVSKHLLPGLTISKTIRDAWGQYWCAGYKTGLYRILHESVQQYPWPNDFPATGMSSDGKHHVYVAAKNGRVLKYNDAGSLLKVTDAETGTDLEQISYIQGKKPLILTQYGILDTLLRWRLPTEWLYRNAGANGGLFYFSHTAGIVSWPVPDLDTLPVSNKRRIIYGKYLNLLRPTYARKVTILPNGDCLGSFNDGLWVVPKNGNPYPILSKQGKPIWTIALEKDWVSLANGGMVRLVYHNGRWQAGETVLAELSLRYMALKNGRLWAVTDNNVLLCYHLNSGKATWHFNSADAIDFSISGMALTQNHVWLATSAGLIRVEQSEAGLSTTLKLEPRKKHLVLAYGQKQEVSAGMACLNPWWPWKWSWAHEERSGNWNPQDPLIITAGAAQDHVMVLKAQLPTKPLVAWNITWRTSDPSLMIFWKEITLGVVLTLLLGGLIISYLLRQRAEQKLLAQLSNSQLTALNAQMNPHFVFNLLQSVQGLVYSQSRERAATVLAEYSELVRLYLEHSRSHWVKLEDEWRTLELYLGLEAMRTEPPMQYEIEIDPAIASSGFIPSMLVQPLIENAIVHGLLHKVGQRKLSVKFIFLTQDSIQVRIKDNGIGRYAAQAIRLRRKHHPFGTQAVQQRLQILRQLTGVPLTLAYIDHRLGNEALGTEVLIVLPLHQHELQSGA